MACIQNCPVEAIEYKDITKGRKRYRLDDYRNSRLNFEKMAEAYVDELADISRYEYALDFLSAYSGDDQMKELEKELRLRIEKEQKSGK